MILNGNSNQKILNKFLLKYIILYFIEFLALPGLQ